MDQVYVERQIRGASPHLRPEFGPRTGARPEVRTGIPQIQLNQWPDPMWIDQLSEGISRLPGIIERESRLADRRTKAFCLPPRSLSIHADALIDDHEFCHIHPAPEGGIHLVLPAPLRQRAIELGWAEYHPLAGIDFLPKSLVLVYAPRDERELAVAMKLIRASHNFALGAFDAE